MYPTNAYVTRQATVHDVAVLRRLVEATGRAPLAGPVLIGEIDGVPAAAVSLADGRVAADPRQGTARLSQILEMRFRSLRAFADQPSLPVRLRAAMSGWKAKASSPAAA
jgi:hypothetical protein